MLTTPKGFASNVETEGATLELGETGTGAVGRRAAAKGGPTRHLELGKLPQGPTPTRRASVPLAFRANWWPTTVGGIM